MPEQITVLIRHQHTCFSSIICSGITSGSYYLFRLHLPVRHGGPLRSVAEYQDYTAFMTLITSRVSVLTRKSFLHRWHFSPENPFDPSYTKVSGLLQSGHLGFPLSFMFFNSDREIVFIISASSPMIRMLPEKHRLVTKSRGITIRRCFQHLYVIPRLGGPASGPMNSDGMLLRSYLALLGSTPARPARFSTHLIIVKDGKPATLRTFN